MQFGAPTNTDVVNFIQAAGPVNRLQTSAIVELVADLKTYGLWNKMKAIYPMVGQSGVSSSFEVNLKDPSTFRGTFYGTWSFTDTGATPDGATGYMDTNLNTRTEYGATFRNNHFSIYYRTDNTDAGKIGVETSSYTNAMGAHIVYTNGRTYNDNLGRDEILNSEYGTSDAHHISNVLDASTKQMWRNGIVKLTGTPSLIGYPDKNFYFGAYNSVTGASNFSNRECAFASIGDGLTDEEADNLYTAVQKFQTTLGRQV